MKQKNSRELHEVDKQVIIQNISKDGIENGEETTKYHFATRLNEELVMQGMTQGDLAKSTGLSSGIISDYRNGKKDASMTNLNKIATELGVSADYLLGNTDAKTTNTEIRAMCDYTGLSENVIALFHHLETSVQLKSLYCASQDIMWMAVDETQKPVSILSRALENSELLETLYLFLVVEDEAKDGIFKSYKANSLMLELQKVLFSLRDEVILDVMRINKEYELVKEADPE